VGIITDDSEVFSSKDNIRFYIEEYGSSMSVGDEEFYREVVRRVCGREFMRGQIQAFSTVAPRVHITRNGIPELARVNTPDHQCCTQQR
jgi:hypothetical protein